MTHSKLIKQLFFLLLFSFVVTHTAYATDVVNTDATIRVKQFYCDLAKFAGGPIGVLVGLAVALYGFYIFIMSANFKGILIVIAGALIPAFPSVIASFSKGVAVAFSSGAAGGINANGGSFATLNSGCRLYSGNAADVGVYQATATPSEATERFDDGSVASTLERDIELQNRTLFFSTYGTLRFRGASSP